MNNADNQKRSIQTELKALEAQNELASDREQLHQRADAIAKTVETLGDPVLKTEYRRRLSTLRGHG